MAAMLGSTTLNLGSWGSQLLNSPSHNPTKPLLLPPVKPFLKSPNPGSSNFLKSRTSVRTAVAAVESSDATVKVEFFKFLYLFCVSHFEFFPRLMLFVVEFEFECGFVCWLILILVLRERVGRGRRWEEELSLCCGECQVYVG